MSESMGTVLVVDDEPDIREVLCMYLERYGFSYYEASDGREGFEVLCDKLLEIDLVLTDVVMPIATGIDLMQSIKNAGYDLPVIFLTGYANKEHTLQALRYGAFDMLEKPFQAEQIIRTITEAIRVSKEQNALSVLEPPYRDILTLSTLRSEGESSIDVKQLENKDEEGLRDFFVEETLSQLMFCKGAIVGLADKESVAFELSYIMRVLTATKDAAKSLGADSIANITKIGSDITSCLRLDTETLSVSHKALLSELVEELIVIVEEYGDGKQRDPDYGLTTKLQTLKKSLESNALG